MNDNQQYEKHIPIMLSVGAAVQDVFLSGKVLTPTQEENGEWVEELPLGAKMDVDTVVFSTGGGATNAAVTFARQGLHAEFLGQIGHDPAGQAVLDDLHKEGVDTNRVIYSDEYRTGYSVLLLAPNGERTILTYRGASTHYDASTIEIENLTADWVYISSLAGNMELMEKIIKTAKAANSKIAVNPGKGELQQADWLKTLLHQCDVLTLNKDEIQLLVEGETDEQLVRHCSDMTPTVIMTDGPNGVTATDRQKIVIGGMYEDVPVIDRTGAGDAFGSGLVAAFAKGKSLADAIVFASANSTSVVGQIGAKDGILSSDDQLHDMPLDVKDF